MSSTEKILELFQTRIDELGITRSELAKRIDATPSYVSQVLTGRISPGLAVVDKIAAALQCSVTFTLKEEKRKKSA